MQMGVQPQTTFEETRPLQDSTNSEASGVQQRSMEQTTPDGINSTSSGVQQGSTELTSRVPSGVQQKPAEHATLDGTNSAPSEVQKRSMGHTTNSTVASNGQPSILGSLSRIKTAVLAAATPERKIGEPPRFWQGLKAVIFHSCESFRRTSRQPS
jgi:hypothetical protein